MARISFASRIDTALAGRPMGYRDLLIALWPGKAARNGREAALQQGLRRYGYTWAVYDRQRIVFPRWPG